MNLKRPLVLLAACLMLAACDEKTKEETEMPYEITKTEAEWKKLLTPEQYRVLREKGTEPSFSNQYHDFKGQGTYVCAACGLPLFDSETKFDSGTGWPSYYQPLTEKSVRAKDDRSFFMVRTEAVCNRCGGHLGHVFDDGPKPTGLRYCINSASLDFVEKKDK